MSEFSKELDKVWNDRHSGSVEILGKYVDLFKRFTDLKGQKIHKQKQPTDLYDLQTDQENRRPGPLRNHPGKSSKYDLPEKNTLLNIIHASIKRHGSFLVVSHFLNEIVGFLESNRRNWQGDLAHLISNYEISWSNVNERIAETAGKLLDLSNKTILLHSNSSAIKSFFASQKTHALKISLIQTESRPLMEGRIQAEFLAHSGYKVKVIADSAIGRYAGIADMAVVGTDGIYSEYFVNKCGSLPIALICREKGIPLYVLADSRKIWPVSEISNHNRQLKAIKGKKSVNRISIDEIFHEEIKPPDELWKNPPANVIVENYYFEIIPNKLVTLFITEKGSFIY